MKKLFTIVSLVVLALSACSKESANGDEKGEGRVMISCVAETTVDQTRANIECTLPAEGDFALRIVGVGNDYVGDFDSIDVFAENNYLRSGEYQVTATAGDITAEGYDKATFVGVENFTVEARAEKTVNVTAKIANALVKVETTEAFNNYFPGGHTLTLKTAAGNEFDVTAQTDPLFIAPESFTITGTATKQPNQSGAEGEVVALPDFKKDELVAQTLYIVKMDVTTAGQAKLTITLNDTLVDTIDIEQELNDYAK